MCERACIEDIHGDMLLGISFTSLLRTNLQRLWISIFLAQAKIDDINLMCLGPGAHEKIVGFL